MATIELFLLATVKKVGRGEIGTKPTDTFVRLTEFRAGRVMLKSGIWDKVLSRK